MYEGKVPTFKLHFTLTRLYVLNQICMISPGFCHRSWCTRTTQILNDTRIYSVGKLKRNQECHSEYVFDIFLRDGNLLQTVLKTKRERSNYNLLIFVVFNERFSVFFPLLEFFRCCSEQLFICVIKRNTRQTPFKRTRQCFLFHPGDVKGRR